MGSPPSSPTLATAPVRPPGSPTPPPSPTISAPECYEFPHSKLKRRLTCANKTPLVLVACGSFSPVTMLHLSMFAMAQRHIKNTEFELVGSYMSPCSDAYNKSSLVPAYHRVEMCNLAINHLKANVEVDDWETQRRDENGRPLYSRTVDVLHHFDDYVNTVLGGIQTVDGTFTRARVMLLIGADLAMTMSNPKAWAPADVDVLLGYYGAFIIERPHQTDIQKAITPLEKYFDNMWIVPSFENDVSSTKVRAQIQRGESAKDLPMSVFKYIMSHHLYHTQKAASKDIKQEAVTAHIPAVSPITS